MQSPVITLTTDFGLRDYFVGSVKGVLLRHIPSAQLVDITHDIPRHDIMSGAFVINEAFRCFPSGTIHIVVVDPGVGTIRRKIVVETNGHFLVAPDNGILTYILQKERCQVYEVENTQHLGLEKSATFAGRDHFAPIAAVLAKGVLPEKMGVKINDSYQINSLNYEKIGERLIGKIVYFDHFGNAITNLTRGALADKLTHSECLTAKLNDLALTDIKNCYEEGLEEDGNLIINSSGYLEIFSLRKSAREILKLNLMDTIIIT